MTEAATNLGSKEDTIWLWSMSTGSLDAEVISDGTVSVVIAAVGPIEDAHGVGEATGFDTGTVEPSFVKKAVERVSTAFKISTVVKAPKSIVQCTRHKEANIYLADRTSAYVKSKSTRLLKEQEHCNKNWEVVHRYIYLWV